MTGAEETAAERPRVLFVASQPFFEWRGSPIRLGFDLMALRDIGFAVDFLTLPLGARREIEGVRIVRAPNVFRAKKIKIGPSALKLGFDAVMLAQAFCMALRRKYAVVHGVEDCGALALAVGKMRGSKVVFEKHSDSASYKKSAVVRAYEAVERRVLRHADAVIGTGPGLVEQVAALRGGRPAHHISDIPSSLAEPDAAGVARARAEMGAAPGAAVALYVGSFAPYQGIDLLFSAMPRALALAPGLRFVIIGGAEDETARWGRWLAERGCTASAAFLGKRAPDALPCYLAAADILLSPRIAGVNTPLKLLDYLKVSRAIAATDHPANRLILDERTALFTAPTAEAFADGVARLAQDPALRARLAADCRRLIDEKYNFGVFREGLARVYRSVGVCGGAPL